MIVTEVKQGDFIKISYTAKLEDGTIIDTTDEKIAKEYGLYNENARYGDIVIVVGEGNVVRGLDEELVGKEVGFKGKIVVPPEKAFGRYDPKKREIVSIRKFPERPRPGQKVRLGNRVGIVERVIGRRAIVDFNHPLAGKTLIFEVEIKEKVEDLAEKIKALFVMYTGLDVEVEVEDKTVRVIPPRGASLNQVFIIGKYDAISRAFKYTDVEKIEIVERFSREEEKKFIEAAKEEAAEKEDEEGEGLQEVKSEESSEKSEEARKAEEKSED